MGSELRPSQEALEPNVTEPPSGTAPLHEAFAQDTAAAAVPVRGASESFDFATD
ncbi:hypothetical protein ACF07Y_10130 [Streptomyces sp. NPDC016566]|uniref:hypothetical protein n=1 Tax=Streptomyces sp. NPDC016566 TaxID=3364967 RepID=UPI0036FF8543